MPEVSFPTRSMIGEKIVPNLRNLGGSATRRQVVDEAIRLGNYTEAQRKKPRIQSATRTTRTSNTRSATSFRDSRLRE